MSEIRLIKNINPLSLVFIPIDFSEIQQSIIPNGESSPLSHQAVESKVIVDIFWGELAKKKTRNVIMKQKKSFERSSAMCLKVHST